MELENRLNVVTQSEFQPAQCAAFRTLIAKEDAHGYQHASPHRSCHSAAWRRRLVRPWTLVLDEDDRKSPQRPFSPCPRPSVQHARNEYSHGCFSSAAHDETQDETQED